MGLIDERRIHRNQRWLGGVLERVLAWKAPEFLTWGFIPVQPP
jgi:hypothetical protein